MSSIKQYEPLWGSWYVDSQIGEGSYGKVYKVHREEFGNIYTAAVKMISIPKDDNELRQAKSDGLDSVSAKSYFHAFVTDIVREIALMNEFRGNSNIVSLEDHKVLEKKDSIGWDILIRMELLTTLTDYVIEHPLSTDDVIRLGIHICRALELCAVKKLIHRDIKPDNIFVSQFGDFKLGDFGIARRIERTLSAMSQKGTHGYMAPEVFKNQEYGASVDLYSLGIVMYKFLNNNRRPFQPDNMTPYDNETALQRRMNGEAVPPIENIDPKLNNIVLKACAYDINDRFRNATEMKLALMALTGESERPAISITPRVNNHVQEREPAESTDPTFQDFNSCNESELESEAKDEDDYEGTIGMFSPQTATQTISYEPEQDAHQDNNKSLAITGMILFAVLGLLAFFSGDKSDIAIFLPIYALCALQCFFKFENNIMTGALIFSLVIYLALSTLWAFKSFDYQLFILTASLIVILTSKHRFKASMLLFSGALIYSGLAFYMTRISYVHAVKAAVIPVLLLLESLAAMLGQNSIGIITALQCFSFITFAAYAFNRSSVYFYIVNANFIGFSPERFSWWTQGRFIGLVLEFLAFSLLIAITLKTKDSFAVNNRTKLFITFIAALAVMITALVVIGILPEVI